LVVGIHSGYKISSFFDGPIKQCLQAPQPCQQTSDGTFRVTKLLDANTDAARRAVVSSSLHLRCPIGGGIRTSTGASAATHWGCDANNGAGGAGRVWPSVPPPPPRCVCAHGTGPPESRLSAAGSMSSAAPQGRRVQLPEVRWETALGHSQLPAADRIHLSTAPSASPPPPVPVQLVHPSSSSDHTALASPTGVVRSAPPA
jgi:hypothetical protein